MTPIIFLDIAGVLLTTRALGMQTNAGVRTLMETDPRAAAQRVTFDQVGVGLLNRLCRVTGAKVVIASSWLYEIEEAKIREKLVAEGVEPDILHSDFCRPRGLEPRHHANSISDWRERHRFGPMPPEASFPSAKSHPPGMASRDEADYAWDGTRLSIGPLKMVGDGRHFFHVTSTLEDGMICQVYRVACRALGGTDPEMGVFGIDAPDWERLLAALDGRVVAAASFLDGGATDWWSRVLEDGGPLPERFWLDLAEYLKPVPRELADDMDF
jgi:hypothetical protein